MDLNISVFIMPAVYTLAGIIVLYLLVFKILGLTLIKTSEIGLIQKWWSTKGSLIHGLVALNGEAGFVPEVLRAGIHFKSRIFYAVKKMPLITISQGQIGYIFARDGEALDNGQTLGKVVECNNFQNVRSFLEHGGQKGSQRGILREGTYAINVVQFIVITEDRIYYMPLGDGEEKKRIDLYASKIKESNGFRPVIMSGQQDMIGIVTINEGLALDTSNGEVIAPVVGRDINDVSTYHNSFQDIEAFLKGNGKKGRQYQVLTEGTFFINRLFATVELKPKVKIPVGFVGVVVSYVGERGLDSSGEDYKHGELVPNGCKGVWKEPYMPGKYPFNEYAGSIFLVPTTNIILKWNSTETGSHKYDENLKEVDLITKDAFEPSLPLSVVVHIDYKMAPMVIQRFGDIKMLIDQTLDPMVASYFKNVGQTKTLIELIQERNIIQEEAGKTMKERFSHYNLELEEVLIGTPTSKTDDNRIETILSQLRDRQVAREQIETYNVQQKAVEIKRSLKEAEAKAEQQSALTKSQIDINIETNKGIAEYQKSKQDAEKIKTLADAEAQKTKMMADADAMRIEKIGLANAIATKKQVEAYGGPQYQVIKEVVTQFSKAIEIAKVDVVPKQVVTMGGSSNEMPSAFDSLVKLMTLNGLGIEMKFDKESIDKEELKEKEVVLDIEYPEDVNPKVVHPAAEEKINS